MGGSSGGSSAGSSSGSAGSSSGAAGTGQCPAWPSHRLMPTVGPLFYGPDPGPCTETSITSASQTVGSYSFDDTGRVTKVSFGSSIRVYNWIDGTLSSISYTGTGQLDVVVEYTWSAAKVTESLPGSGESIREYLLDAAGYPTQYWLTDPSLGTRRLGASYTYVDCRLTHREAFNADGSSDSRQTADYKYDALGHMATRNNADGSETVFDYSCW